jgi:nucleotide-binding universal stress UspA family protein
VRDQLARELGQLQRQARLAGTETRTQARLAEPVQQIIRAAEELHADLIVTGHAVPRRFMRRFAVFTATSRLIANARCAALVIR